MHNSCPWRADRSACHSVRDDGMEAEDGDKYATLTCSQGPVFRKLSTFPVTPQLLVTMGLFSLASEQPWLPALLVAVPYVIYKIQAYRKLSAFKGPPGSG